jgi:hypothetical protein
MTYPLRQSLSDRSNNHMFLTTRTRTDVPQVDKGRARQARTRRLRRQHCPPFHHLSVRSRVLAHPSRTRHLPTCSTTHRLDFSSNDDRLAYNLGGNSPLPTPSPTALWPTEERGSQHVLCRQPLALIYPPSSHSSSPCSSPSARERQDHVTALPTALQCHFSRSSSRGPGDKSPKHQQQQQQPRQYRPTTPCEPHKYFNMRWRVRA